MEWQQPECIANRGEIAGEVSGYAEMGESAGICRGSEAEEGVAEAGDADVHGLRGGEGALGLELHEADVVTARRVWRR